MELDESGFLREHDVLLIGTSSTTIKKAEDRLEFKKTMEKIHEPVAPSEVVTNIKGGLAFVKKIGYPVVLRPAYTLGGSGGGIAENEEEFEGDPHERSETFTCRTGSCREMYRRMEGDRVRGYA